MDFNKLDWYIIPYNMTDVRILGADSSDVRKEREEDRIIFNAKAYVRLYDLSKRLGVHFPKVTEKGWYELYLEPHRYKKYTWEGIQKVSLKILFEWFSKSGFRVDDKYKAKAY
jgi:hypothetical protein